MDDARGPSDDDGADEPADAGADPDTPGEPDADGPGDAAADGERADADGGSDGAGADGPAPAEGSADGDGGRDQSAPSDDDPDEGPVNPEVAAEAVDPEPAGADAATGGADAEDVAGPIDYTPRDWDEGMDTADAAGAAVGDEPPDPDPGAGVGAGWQGPDEDQEMPLTAHVEEMLKRLAVIVAIAGVVSLVTFPFAETLVNFLWNSLLPRGDLTRPRLYGILELKLTELKVASLAGLIVALPVFVYETYQFMRPGLYPHERRYYLAAIPTSLVLAFVGVSFAYFVILPAIFTYFLYYSQDVATIGFALGKTFDLILLLMGYMALVFQIPLFIMLAMMMNLVTRQWLADRRLLFWGAFLGISFIFSPDPTGMAPIIVALTMVGLFEGTLLLTKWTRRGRERARG